MYDGSVKEKWDVLVKENGELIVFTPYRAKVYKTLNGAKKFLKTYNLTIQ